MEGGLQSFTETFKDNAHSNHQKSTDEHLHGTINCFPDTDGVVFKYIYIPPSRPSKPASTPPPSMPVYIPHP